MTTPTTPSDALASLMSLLNALDTDASRGFSEVSTLFTTASDELEDEQQRAELAGTPVDWADLGDEILDEPDVRRGLMLAEPPRNAGEMLDALRAVAALDEWHRPLTPFLAQPRDVRSAGHEAADDRLTNLGRYNADEAHGALVPARSPHMPLSAEPEVRDELLRKFHVANPLCVGDGKALLLAGLLDHAAYLPRLVLADHADHPGVKTRKMRVRYLRAPGLPLAGRSAGDPVRLGVAPVLEERADADLVLNAAGDRYGVVPTSKPARLQEVLRRARDQAVELLFIPEMAVAAGDLPAFAQAIDESGREHVLRTGAASPLRYVLVGIATPPAAAGMPHRNHLVILDSSGSELVVQDKLFHWNLSDQMQARLDLPEPPSGYAPICYEDIEPGEQVWVVDLDGVGRVATLICADVNANRPGDWLFANANLDWFNAPIMDQSTRWGLGGSKALDQWIARRAHRAACATGARVVVTNSMLLSYRVNDANAAAGVTGFPPFDTVQIGLLVDAAAGAPVFTTLDVALHPRSTVLEMRDWCDGFAPFPV